MYGRRRRNAHTLPFVDVHRRKYNFLKWPCFRK